MNRRPIIAVVALAFGLGGLMAILAWLAIGYTKEPVIGNAHPTWKEVNWPFPSDEWGRGKAFQCKAADCGAEIMVFGRDKIGFCNCTIGVADDEELSRLSDFILMGEKIEPLGPGQPIRVAWMKGRSRGYALPSPLRAPVSAL